MEIRHQQAREAASREAADEERGAKRLPGKTVRQAMTQILIADFSMSLDNVLGVAAVAREHPVVLVIGLALSVAFMGFAASIIARLLEAAPMDRVGGGGAHLLGRGRDGFTKGGRRSWSWSAPEPRSD